MKFPIGPVPLNIPNILIYRMDVSFYIGKSKMINIHSKLFILILFLIIHVACSQNKASLNVGDRAPLFTTNDSRDSTFKLEDFKGRKLLIHFWADWCAECRAEFPKLEAAYQKNKENFEILAINVAQSEEHVESFVKEFNLTFPMLLDKNSEIAARYGIRGLPTNYFINRDLKIEKIIIGWVDEKQINQAIKN